MSEADVIGNRQLYKLIARQLQYDGYTEAANAVSESTITTIPRADPEGNELFKMVQSSGSEGVVQKKSTLASWDGLHSYFGQGSEMINRYIGRHPKEVRSIVFSPDGEYVVAGDAAGSMQFYQCETMINHRGEAKTHSDTAIARKYEGNGFSIEDIVFHPDTALIAAGTREGKIHFYNYWKPRDKTPVRTLDDEYMVRCLSMHPSGQFLLSGTEHTAPRLWDIERKSAFIPPVATNEVNTGMINSTDFSPDGRTFVAASVDGSVTIYDPSQPKWKIAPIRACHSGAEVTSVQYSRNGNYVLSAGKDGCARIYDMRNYQCTVSYGKPRQIEHRAIAKYASHDDAIVCVLKDKDKVLILDRAMQDKIQLSQPERHTKQFRCLAASPRAPFFATGDDGFRTRFWTPKDATDYMAAAAAPEPSRLPERPFKKPKREPPPAPKPMSVG